MAESLIVITGASSGIGLATAKAFSRAGHALLLISRNIEPLPEFQDKPVRYAKVDVADAEALQRAVKDAEGQLGGVECLVNSAGTCDVRAFDQVEPADYEHEIATNLLGVLNGMHAVLPGMRERQRGTIINISSVSDRKTGAVAVGYAASKYAVRAATQSLREAEGKHNIRVINIAPGYIKTNIHKGMGITFEQYRQAFGNPDFMTAEELAEIIYSCFSLPQHLCIRDLVVAPTRTTF